METLATQGCKADREPRDIDLGHAINQIDEVIDHAEETLRRILGEKVEVCGAESAAKVPPPINMPSLAMLMNEGADNIRMKISRLHELLNDIEQTLF